MNTATLICFLALQFCDFATTLCFLGRGVPEGNPLVRAALQLSNNPALSLLAVKAAACGLGLVAWRSRRLRILRGANWMFALCVGWNLAAIAQA